MSNNINRTISPGLLCASSLFVCKPLHPPNKKTFNSHCILLFCGLHPLRSIPPRLPRPLAPPWLPGSACAPLMRSRLTASQRSSSSSSWSWHSSRAREAAASPWSSGEGQSSRGGRWWKVMEGIYKDHWDMG
jgi:hypothetical protein